MPGIKCTRWGSDRRKKPKSGACPSQASVYNPSTTHHFSLFDLADQMTRLRLQLLEQVKQSLSTTVVNPLLHSNLPPKPPISLDLQSKLLAVGRSSALLATSVAHSHTAHSFSHCSELTSDIPIAKVGRTFPWPSLMGFPCCTWQ